MPAMAYHAKSDRIVMYGGVFDTEAEGDRHVWTCDLNSNTWEQLGIALGVPIEALRMVYDAESNLMVSYGGGPFMDGGSRTYVYDLETDSWTKISQENNPGVLSGHTIT
jgi:hypothetical protein